MPAIYNLLGDKSPGHRINTQNDNVEIGAAPNHPRIHQRIASVSNRPVSLLKSLGEVLLYATITVSATVFTACYITDKAEGINDEQPGVLGETHHGHYRSVHQGVYAGLLGGTVSGLFAGLTMRKLLNACNTVGLHIESKWYRVGYSTVAGLVLGGVGGGMYGSIIHQKTHISLEYSIMPLN